MARALIVVDFQNDFTPGGALGVPDGDAITGLGDTLRGRGINALTVVGLATDYCVLHTAVEGVGEGFAVRVEAGATRPVEVSEGDGERALQTMREAGVEIA